MNTKGKITILQYKRIWKLWQLVVPLEIIQHSIECFRHFASEKQEQAFKTQLKTILEAMLEDEKDISLRLIYSGDYQ